MMEDHLLIAGLSELCFKENVVALGCNSAMPLEDAVLRIGLTVRMALQ